MERLVCPITRSVQWVQKPIERKCAMFITRKQYDELCARLAALEAAIRPAPPPPDSLAAQWASFWAYNGNPQQGGDRL